ncbi:hypothetical protein HUJ04_011022 [Dendroctonus ponderosae]|nr:hypothetical protein HUJ04_011022 [Dendroctonus ponderosae]
MSRYMSGSKLEPDFKINHYFEQKIASDAGSPVDGVKSVYTIFSTFYHILMPYTTAKAADWSAIFSLHSGRTDLTVDSFL